MRLRQRLLQRALAQERKFGLQQLLFAFSHTHVPGMLENELEEFERVLNLDDHILWGIIRRPARTVEHNAMLERFVGFSRFRMGASEFR